MSGHRHIVHPQHIPNVRAVAARSTYRYARHSHDEFGIGLMVSGAQVSASGHGPVEAIRGDLITVTPGEVHDGAPAERAARGWAMLYFEPALVATVWQEEGTANPRQLEFLAPVLADDPRRQDFLRLYRLATGPLPDDFAVEEALSALLPPLLRTATAEAPQGAVARVIDCLRDDPAADHSLAELAALAGLSRYQLIRAMKKATGFTPFAFRRQQRIALARRLIATGALLGEAAAASGFADQSHLTRAFAESLGVTPGRLRASAMAFKTSPACPS